MKTRWLSLLFLLMSCSWSLKAQGFGEKQLLNDGWSFNLGDGKYFGIELFDHSKWQKVDLPHDWSVEQYASPDNASCTGYLPGGIAWYRRFLDIPSAKKGQKVYIYFEGVYNNSEVFINGKWIGKRPNGYISFMYDMTPYINYGGRNVIAVRVDHSQDADSRWYTGSGIYRDVYLVYSNPVHINLWGVNYETTVKQGSADVALKTEICNDENKEVTVQVKHQMLDAAGKVVATSQKSLKVKANSTVTGEQKVSVRKPVLWDVDNPYLYKIVTEVRQNGKVIDQSEVNAGIRKLTFDANNGFALNDKSMKMKGVCIHHDAGCLGAAVPVEVWKRRLQAFKEIGCNAIRMSHNPQATCLYDLCDEMGFLVIDEAYDEWEYPKKKWIKGWNQGEPGFEGAATYFREWGRRDLADLIRRDRNHPSVIMWSIGNEIDYPNDPYSHPILEESSIKQKHVQGYQITQPRAERLGDIAKELVAEAKKYDTTRPVTAALAGAVMSNETDYPGALDVVGYNYTEDRYKMDHQKYPDRIFYGSENGKGLDAWKAVTDNDFVMGQYLWAGIDFLGEAGSWPSRGSGSGVLTIDGRIKPNGYYRRALWLEKPNIYLGSYIPTQANDVRDGADAVWNYTEGETVRVVAYTNCEEAELFLNGKQVGKRMKAYNNSYIMYWDVPYAKGKLEVKGYNGGKVATTGELQSTGAPYLICARLDKTEGVKANDILHLDILIKDDQSHLIPLADNEVTCTITGPAKLLGLDNGGSVATDNYRDNRQKCIKGRALGYIKVLEGSGDITITVSSPMLKSKVLKIKL